MSRHNYSMLCLGDSYTIGEGVPLFDSYPYQVLQLLRQAGFHFHAPEIVAKTGWTTFELAEKLLHTVFIPPYDFVTLLIGVNNQYRNLPINEYEEDLTFLVKKAIHFAGENAKRVIIVSIPNWGESPFACDKNPADIAHTIALFNECNKQMAKRYATQYVDLTANGNIVENTEGLYTSDGLHPSATEYARWSALIAQCITNTLKH